MKWHLSIALFAASCVLVAGNETLERSVIIPEVLGKAGYFTAMTGPNGQVGYSSPQGGSDATTSIGTLVMAIARRKDLPQFKQAAEYLRQKSGNAPQQSPYPNYTRYYRAQALFQSDVEAWQQWNNGLVQQLKAQRQPDGSLAAQNGPDGGQIAGTSLTLLSLAVNFRFLPIYER
jgi:hypothetical protein